MLFTENKDTQADGNIENAADSNREEGINRKHRSLIQRR